MRDVLEPIGSIRYTPKFNIAPEKGTFQEEASLPTTVFQGRAVKLQECKCFVACFDQTGCGMCPASELTRG